MSLKLIRLLKPPQYPFIFIKNFTSKHKLVSKQSKVKYIPTTHRNDDDHKVGKKLAIETLSSLFQIRPFAATNLVERNKNLYKVNRAFLTNIYTIYRENDVTNETLLKYPELLSETSLEKKIILIRKMPLNINNSIVLVLIPYDKLQKFVREECSSGFTTSRIAILTENLNITEQEVCELFWKKGFLCSLSSSVIASKLQILLEYGVKPEDIRKDLWVLRYSTKLITNRLNDAKSHSLDPVKCWMVRAQPEIFQHYMQRRSDNKLILGNSSLAEYLSERLECSVDVANYIISKQPVLKNKSLKKIKDLLDYLFSAGFNPIQICRVPKILVHSVETTAKRLQQLEEHNLKIDSLSMLTKSQRVFNLQYDTLLKNKNKMQNAQ